jgi:hypothetical protein
MLSAAPTSLIRRCNCTHVSESAVGEAYIQAAPPGAMGIPSHSVADTSSLRVNRDFKFAFVFPAASGTAH